MATAEQMPEEAGLHPNGALGPYTSAVVQLAALGDMWALRDIFTNRLSVINDDNVPLSDRMLISMEAIMFGRLIASRGNADDIRKLASALTVGFTLFRAGGRPDLGAMFAAETLSILEQLAEAGDDLAAVCSAELMKGEDPGIVAKVRALRRRITEEKTS